jgi:hypothetical protein
MRVPGGRTRRQLLAQARIRGPAGAALARRHGHAREVVISLTSYPARIDVAWQALRSLLRQSVRADRVVLVVYEGDFPDRRLPPRVEACRAEGLEVLWSPENAPGHLKLLPVMAAYPDALIVTADDDTLYPRRWLAGLLRANDQNPTAILAYRAHEIGVSDGQGLRPYKSWPYATAATPWQRVFPTGVGGVLYPPGSLPHVAFDLDTALDLCPTADDVWFKAMSLLKGTPSLVVNDRKVNLVVVLRSQNETLMQVNVGRSADGRSANDDQLERTLTRFELWPRLLAANTS